jgi:quercetin 2,3-dioxygenase
MTVVAPGAGFPTHPHRDSLGNGSIIRPGDAQRMTAGRGVAHSEFNPSPDRPVRLLQIWILPDRQGLSPGYEQRNFAEAERRGRLRQIVSPDGAEGSITIHQDARVYAGRLDAGASTDYGLKPGRRAWLHIARGTVRANGTRLGEGDGAAAKEEPHIAIEAIESIEDSEMLLFDLP